MDTPNTAELNGSIPETTQVRVPDLERIRNARKRRMIQIKEWQQYDRKMTRESEKQQRKGYGPGGDKNMYKTGPQVKFPQSLIFLEAAARGDLDEVRKLLSNGVCPDVANEDGLTALHQQMYRFSAEEAAELRSLSAEDARDCCIDNTPEMCRLLLRFGANPNARDTERWTPLHAAATCHHTELCAILIAHGADLLAMNADGNMPYECCLPGPTLSLIETEMDKRGITQEELDDLRRLPECEMLADMEALYKSGADLNVLDKQGASMLHIAAACGYEEVTIFLLKHGAKINQLDRDGWQAIHIAACWEHLDIIEILVNYGADIMAETTSGETVFDICDDLEMHARLVEIKEEAERKQFQQDETHNRPEKPRELVRRRSSTNPRSASIRRTSMREKKMISWKEAKQEAEMRGVASLDLGDGDFESATPESVKPAEASADRRVTSPLSVNTRVLPNQQQQQHQQQQQSHSNGGGHTSVTSPVVSTVAGKHPSSPQSPPIAGLHVQNTELSQSPRPKRPPAGSTNGLVSPAVSDTSAVANMNRFPSKGSERNSETDVLSLRPLTGQKGDFQKSRTAATPKEETKHVDVKNTVSDRISVSDSNPQGLFNRLESKRQSSRRKSKSSQKQSDGTSKPSVETKKREVPHRSSSISGLLTVDTRKHSRINNVSKSDDKQSLSTVTERMETSHLRRTRSLPNRTNRSKYTSSSRESQDPSSSGRPQPTARTRRVVLVSDARGPIGPETASTYDASRDSGANNPSSNPAEGNSMAAPPTSRMVSATSMPTRTLSNRSTRSTKYIESPRNGRSQSKWCCCS